MELETLETADPNFLLMKEGDNVIAAISFSKDDCHITFSKHWVTEYNFSPEALVSIAEWCKEEQKKRKDNIPLEERLFQYGCNVLGSVVRYSDPYISVVCKPIVGEREVKYLNVGQGTSVLFHLHDRFDGDPTSTYRIVRVK